MPPFDYEGYIKSHPAKSILGKGNSPEEMRDNSFRFVNTVCLDLRKMGHVEVKVYEKTSGSNSFGYASDILVVDNTIYDCVVGSDGPEASPSFQDKGPADLSRVVLPDPSITVGTVVVPPVPPVPPIPPVNPTHPPLPNYGQCLDEMDQLAARYFQKHGHTPGPRDFGHWAMRRFVEHWKFEDMLADI